MCDPYNKAYGVNMVKQNRYVRITQKPYCCAAACLEMILRRRGITTYDQKPIAVALGLRIPKKYSHMFEGARVVKDGNYGTNIYKYPVNEFFKKNRIKLKFKYVLLLDEVEARRFVDDSINNGRDVMVCFGWGKLYGKSDPISLRSGHVCNIIGTEENGKVKLMDPSAGREGGVKTVSLAKLMDAIAHHNKKKGHMAGFWLIG